ncbi:hypothetical protein D1831_03795 [Lactiplantibacillus garii]|uniref:Uncharacterized protein n=1 Tax=Lactiplantibacillus garii TaxID=2306423 RepID=A0A426D9C8_9LACO|nr:hypothetical protein D1831_03795 [Lactiplantibacillus garii]
MRLIDFNLSTVDLTPSMPLFWETGTHQVVPIQAVQLRAGQLILIPKSGVTPLTLNQLNARTRQLSGPTQLYVQTPDNVQPLFGYRLHQARLLLG